jgi:glycosyltransferase involved in cell wall biosynthesis
VSRASAYAPLLFTGIAERYEPRYREDASLDDAIAARDAGATVIVHVHWEEFVLRACASDADADAAVAAFARRIAALHARRVPIVWTIHNETPHEIGYLRAFFAFRALLAEAADVVLVHNAVSIEVLARQVALDRAKVRLLPHPSYLGRLEDADSLRAGLAVPHGPWIQGFGWIRRQKGFGAMIAALPPAFLAARGLAIRISGSGDEAAAVVAEHAARTDVVWDVRHVPDAEIPALLRSALCVVLPYERVLTSGAALLAMSVGAMLVAVDLPQLRELVAVEGRRFLYPRGDGEALRRAIDAVAALPHHERRTIADANLALARRVHPAAISARLAAIYDALVR